MIELFNEILAQFPEGSIIAGGAVRDTLIGADVRDIDVFVPIRRWHSDIYNFKRGKIHPSDLYKVTLDEFNLKSEDYPDMLHVHKTFVIPYKGWPINVVIAIGSLTEMVDQFPVGLSQCYYVNGKIHTSTACDLDISRNTLTIFTIRKKSPYIYQTPFRMHDLKYVAKIARKFPNREILEEGEWEKRNRAMRECI